MSKYTGVRITENDTLGQRLTQIEYGLVQRCTAWREYFPAIIRIIFRNATNHQLILE